MAASPDRSSATASAGGSRPTSPPGGRIWRARSARTSAWWSSRSETRSSRGRTDSSAPTSSVSCSTRVTRCAAWCGRPATSGPWRGWTSSRSGRRARSWLPRDGHGSAATSSFTPPGSSATGTGTRSSSSQSSLEGTRNALEAADSRRRAPIRPDVVVGDLRLVSTSRAAGRAGPRCVTPMRLPTTS